jgi:very-short-patch-repair endonuclease
MSTSASVLRYQSTIVDKVCIECGTPFRDKRRRKAICSAKCKSARRSRFRPQTFRNCHHCGRQFGPIGQLAAKFCSHACKVQSQKGCTPWNKGKSCPQLYRAETRECLACGTAFRATRDFWSRKQLYCSHRCYVMSRRVSEFEKRVLDRIEGLGIGVERCCKVGKWTFDGRLAGTNILVEVDGSYWHSTAKVKARDILKDVWCGTNGFDLIRIPEAEFTANPKASIEVAVARWEQFTGKKAVKVEGANG